MPPSSADVNGPKHRFTLDPTEDQAKALARHFVARRKAYGPWHPEADIRRGMPKKVRDSRLCKPWNTVKDDVCVNRDRCGGLGKKRPTRWHRGHAGFN